MVKLENRMEEFKLACGIADGIAYVSQESLSNVDDGKINTPLGICPITEVIYLNSRSEELSITWEKYISLGRQAAILGKVAYMPKK